MDILSHVNGIRGISEYAVISSERKKRNKTLAEQIRKSLAFSFSKTVIDVTVFGSAVVLSGQTDTLAKRRKIVEEVEFQDGVSHIVNKINVKGSSTSKR